MKKIFKNWDRFLIVPTILLFGIGLLSIYSSSFGRGDFSNFKKQIIFGAIGIFLMLLFSFLDWRIFRDSPYFLLIVYFLLIIFLVLIFFFGPQIRGVKGWYKIGELTVHPVEFVKIVLILLLAKYFSKRHIEMYRIQHIVLSGFYVLVPALLVFFQPDLGSVLILIAIWVGILIASGIKLRHFFILCFCFFLILIFSWSFLLKEYQKERIIAFLQPKLANPLEIGWSHRQAKIAIGSGGLLGQGLKKGSQTQLGFLPEPQTDFIFSAIAEETGFLGITILFLLFGILIWRIFKIAFVVSSNFPRLFAVGFSVYLMSQIFVHMGTNLGILPIVGISLPLVSYGGSNLIITFLGLGILGSISKELPPN